VSTTRPPDESPDDSSDDDERAGRARDHRPSDSPLDDLFIVGAKYHEPSAAERAAAAKAQERAAKKANKANEKEIARTRRVLGGDNSGRHARRGRRNEFSVASYERRTALLGFLAIIAISVALSFTAFAH
jgi:hypothetical protein